MADTKVYLIDDHAAVRDALGEMLGVFGFTVEVHSSAESFLRALPARPSGCVVTDVRMPGMDGIALVRELATRNPTLPVILISGHADVPMAVAGIKAGAFDFIEKPVDDAALVAAINRALQQAVPDKSNAASDPVEERFARLTPRQIEIFDYVAQGFTSQTIAAKLGISIRTVESYRAQVMEKMQADSIAALVRQAIRLRRITP